MNYAPLMLYIVITCITPGPNNIMCMYLGAHCGLRGARKFMTASIAMFFIKMLLCGILNVALADVLPEIVPYLKWLGAAYMLYLAIHILMDGFRKKQDNVDEAVQTGESGYKRGVLLLLCSLWILFQPLVIGTTAVIVWGGITLLLHYGIRNDTAGGLYKFGMHDSRQPYLVFLRQGGAEGLFGAYKGIQRHNGSVAAVVRVYGAYLI